MLLKRFVKNAIVVGVASVSMVGVAQANDLPELLRGLIQTNAEVKSAEAKLGGAKSDVSSKKGEWFPTVTVNAKIGHEGTNQGATPFTDARSSELKTSFDQLLWDFGQLNAEIDAERANQIGKEYSVSQTTQKVLRSGAKAYIDLVAAYRVLENTKAVEGRIREQTASEEKRLKIGAGLRKDVLQSEAELSRAIEKRLKAELNLAKAMNGYRQWFNVVPDDLSKLNMVDVNVEIPSMEDMIAQFEAQNYALLETKQNIVKAVASKNSTRAKGYFPEVTLTGSYTFQNDMGGTVNYDEDTSILVNVKMPFNLGLAAVHDVNSAQHKVEDFQAIHDKARDALEKNLRDTYQKLITSKELVDRYQQSVKLNEDFLTLARKERKLGGGSMSSLLSILIAERKVIEANSDLEESKADVVSAKVELLEAIGRLSPDLFVQQ
ncbi:outer membrane efflux protein [Magnetococcus marinus MC-1]|uniref:Outer membrane efflux protein n=1 Tax=Magnetococcus marinus (strain ATCC BAA-1437 / JCM 17883 / MC-1) TaxID=156889 RepID=A0LBY8_MAGMM|nr:TolC family protein [Magnetococcus marinus]ABK45481.1 outer membrane efflux protein [Magnetococcus marinus MC-1]